MLLSLFIVGNRILVEQSKRKVELVIGYDDIERLQAYTGVTMETIYRSLQKAGITLVVEALNDKDVPGFYLVRTQDALNLFDEVGHPNLYFQYDIYHMQIMEGNLAKTIQENISRIGHIQLADVPGRHEPGTGEIDFPALFKCIDEAGYTGWIGCEYKPAGVTEDGLGWVKPYF